MFKRKIYSEMLNWKNSPNHKPLIVRGLRQVGKTTIVERFAKDNYEHVFKLDFRKDTSLHLIFDGDFDIDEIVFALTMRYKNEKVVPGKTVFIFDELQDCPNARASLKYFSLDGRYDVICTGSLLGIKNYRITKKPSRGIPVGFEDFLDMKPMDFEEFLWAKGIPEKIINTFNKQIEECKPINDFIHKQMLDLFNKYICIGGMPEVVDTYILTNDFNQVKKVQKRILNDFEADFGTHLNDDNQVIVDPFAKTKILEAFKSIPKQLAKENQKFQYSIINKGKKARDYKTSIEWLEDYGLVSRCYNLTLPSLPFDSFIDDSVFKLFVNDSGLYIAMLEEDIPQLIIDNKIEIAKGAIYENIVADSFYKLGKKLFYFHKDSGLEIDFISKYQGEACLVEVKAKKGRTKSSKTILENPSKYHVNTLIKLTQQNIGFVENIYTFPYYLTSFVFK